MEPLYPGWLVQDPKAREFKDKWPAFTESKHSIAVTSCTTGLHLFLAELSLESDDELIVQISSWNFKYNLVEHAN